jgi:predicted Kef-type K+ transport protein
MQFCLVFGVFQIVILALRFVFRDSVERKAETVSGVVFWLGVAVFLGLLANGSLGWFSFIAGFVVSVGLSVVARNIVRLFRRQSSTDERI